jgi:hypothetical protein
MSGRVEMGDVTTFRIGIGYADCRLRFVERPSLGPPGISYHQLSSRRNMSQLSFTPPTRDPELDILQHLWASKNAISSWESQTPKFIEIRVGEAVDFLLKVHPKLTRPMSGLKALDSIWGIPVRVDYSLPEDPGYTIIYTRGVK